MKTVELLPANSYGDLGAVFSGWVCPRRGNEAALRAFELKFGELFGGVRVACFSAGRVALAAIVHALGIGPGDEIILPGYTCVAVPNPILYRGAIPVYADIDPTTLNVTSSTVEARISSRTRALIVQHTFGYPAPMESLLSLAHRYGFAVVEDCTHALGATFRGRSVGLFGDAAFFSLEQTKMISAGTGGVAIATEMGLAQAIEEFHGRCAVPTVEIVRKTMAYLAYTIVLRDPRWAAAVRHADYYLERLGLIAPPVSTEEEMKCERPACFEQRLPGAQARVATKQLASLSDNLARRRRLASIYFDELSDSSIGLFYPDSLSHPSYVRFPIRVRNKAALHLELAQQGVQLGLWFTAPVHPIGVPQLKAGYSVGSCPHAEDAVATVANLPCHPRMTELDAQRVARLIRKSTHA